jgi:hypothetical protein
MTSYSTHALLDRTLAKDPTIAQYALLEVSRLFLHQDRVNFVLNQNTHQALERRRALIVIAAYILEMVRIPFSEMRRTILAIV